ncbi:HET-domain-containing protein [Byssothecium circinans]|uniref:HET-domain-containing protein n=1 Tax=Byssothecium circinans TaxID=147558 RepID=A0A6A5TLI1_9PLEO|nr:HET-domain-containing protein [Byssothecium circinans]
MTPELRKLVVNDALCEQCIDASNSEQHGQKRVHHPDLHSLRVAAQRRCPICVVIFREASAALQQHESLDAISHCKSTIDFHEKDQPPGGSITIQWKIQSTSTLLLRSGFLELKLLHDDLLQCWRHAASYEYPASTSDLPVANLAQSWLENCVRSHSKCQPSDHLYCPPRLLDLSGESPRLRIIDRNAIPEGASSYAALSHCWGPNPEFLTLTTANIQEFSIGISMHDLPQNFQDAIVLCQNMQIRYLWIDSLCILQSGDGSDADWHFHVTEMRRIYSNCIVNIAASCAADAQGGFLVRRESDLIKPVVVLWPIKHKEVSYSKRCGFPQKPYLFVSYPPENHLFQDLPLNRRGWVFQERLLSPRVIHFYSDQVHWECLESCGVCESYPVGLDQTYRGTWWVPKTRLPNEDSIKNGGGLWIAQYAELVNQYTRRELTFPHVDKLPAFAGVAEHFGQYLQDHYIAGFFKSTLLPSLIWTKDWGERRGNAHKSTSSATNNTYRCPTWSWAKMDCAVRMVPIFYGRLVPEVVKAEVTLTDPTNPYGRLDDACLVLRGPLMPFKMPYIAELKCVDLEDPPLLPANAQHGRISVRAFLDDPTLQAVDLRSLFFLSISSVWIPSNNNELKSLTQGLLLRQKENVNRELYERIGVLYLYNVSPEGLIQAFGDKVVELV